MEVDEIEKRSVVELCREYLGSGWAKVNIEDVVCQRISSGVANKTYYCSIERCTNLENYEKEKHKQVIVHVSGHLFTGKSKDLLKFSGSELIIGQVLHYHGLAAKLLGVFPEGRIEDYIPSKTASVEDLQSLELCKAVIRKMAKFHSLEIPISKRPSFLEIIAHIYRSTIIAKEDIERFSPEKVKAYHETIEFPFEEEYAWIAKYMPKIGGKVVFSHNDVNPNNILIKLNAPVDDRIVLIDYESSTYFYRGYDIAYFFYKKNIRSKISGTRIVVEKLNVENNYRSELLEEYLREEFKLNPQQFNPMYDNLDHLSMEVDFFELVHYLFMIGLRKSILRDSDLDIDWNFWGKEISLYANKKRTFLEKFGSHLTN